ncbi:MAG: rhomboid family intramembrane serine protease [Acidobacteriota bacterium]|nr:rhomboid family intramembrane serine protease [Acidobacteriota bacterium]
MSRFSLGGLKEICPECEKQMAPYRAQAAAIPSAVAAATPAVTLTLLVLNGLYFIVMVASGVSPFEPDGLQILRWGSEYGPLTLGPEPWRLFTCMFIHIGVIHLLFNMWCLWDLGRMAETLYGRAAFLALYLASGVCGSYLSLAWNPLRGSAGASGAIFGVAGALIAGYKFGNLAIDRVAIQKTLRSVALFAFYNLVIGLGGNINNMAHLGGLIGGLAIGFAFTRFFPPRSERYERAFLPLLGVIVVALLLGYFGLRRMKSDVLAYGQADLALERDDCATAMPLLAQAMEKRPAQADVHRALAFCYEKSERVGDAVREYRRAVELDATDAYSWNRLGWLTLDKDPAQAADAFRAALRADPKSVEAHQGLGLALVDSGHAGEGLKELEQAAASSPSEPKVLHALAYAYRKLGRPADEIKPLTHLAELTPNDPKVHADLADAYEKLGDMPSATHERQLAKQLEEKQAGTPAR